MLRSSLLPPDPDATAGLLPLVKIIELKWLLAGEGVFIHVERLQRDPDYARQTLDQAATSASPALRAAAVQLRSRLSPA
jgi:hypothetical protein